MRGPICFGAANEEVDGKVRTWGMGWAGAGWASHFGAWRVWVGEGPPSRNSLVYLQCLAPTYRVTKLLLQLRWAPWLIGALMASGGMTDSRTRISGWVMHVLSFFLCSIFFFFLSIHFTADTISFLSSRVEKGTDFYRLATWIMVNWTFSVSVGTSKGGRNATFEF